METAGPLLVGIARGIGHPSLPVLIMIPLSSTESMREMRKMLLSGEALSMVVEGPGEGGYAFPMDFGKGAFASAMIIPPENLMVSKSVFRANDPAVIECFNTIAAMFARLHNIVTPKGDPVGLPWLLSVSEVRMLLEDGSRGEGMEE